VGQLGARLVVAGVSSGVGKTTVATGLMAALRRRGHVVASAKVGPDYIDPGYHALATGRAARNLDSWLAGDSAIPALAGRAAAGADLLIVEGVMGMFDGAGSGPEASTAAVARLLDAPVVLVVDASAMSGSVAALVHGYASFDPEVRVAGVVLNMVGSDGHLSLLREALAPLGLPVLGALRRDDAFAWRDRHLGLVPVAEQPDQVLRALERVADAVTAGIDLAAVTALARSAPLRQVADPPRARLQGRARIGVATGAAFGFVYPDNLEALRDAGAELVPFDPTLDRHLPEPGHLDGLYLAGGFPEVFAPRLAENQPLLRDVAHRVGAGLVTWAECGGLLWLSRSLDGHPLVGAVPAEATMTTRLTLGYRRAVLRRSSPLGPVGTRLLGHEFHYSTLDPPGDALDLDGRSGTATGGYATAGLFASYLHLHLGGDPSPAERFVGAAARAC